MSTTRYEVPPGGGYYAGVPGIWQGGEVIEYDEETGEVTVLEPATSQNPATPSEEAAARPGTVATKEA